MMMCESEVYSVVVLCCAVQRWLLLARRTLSSTKELRSVVMSFFTSGKESKDSDQNAVFTALAEDVRWKFLIDGTFTEMAYKKVKTVK